MPVVARSAVLWLDRSRGCVVHARYFVEWMQMLFASSKIHSPHKIHSPQNFTHPAGCYEYGAEVLVLLGS